MNLVEDSSDVTIGMISESKSEHIKLTDPDLLSEAQSNPEVDVKIADPKGKIINSSNKFHSNINILSDIGITRKVENNDKELIIRNSRVVLSGGKVRAYIQVSRSMEKEYAFIKLLFIVMIIADFFGIIISVFAGYLISRRTLKPIDKITRAAKNISATDLNSRIDVGEADDELASGVKMIRVCS
jgi:nitrogen fixation/metabolism regulation signal transduction histidine kinase